MPMHAVITGDIVDSTRIKARTELLTELKSALNWVEQKYNGEYDIYRGDSFQIDIPVASDAIPAAILVRAHIIANSPIEKARGWDTRVSIGIGRRGIKEGAVRERDGEAFILSGKGLDEINKTGTRLVLRTPFPDLDNDLDLLTRFADEIISNWSHYSAETAFWYLFFEKSQIEIGTVMGKTQPTISKRVSTGKIKLIDMYIEKAQEMIKRIN